MEKYLIFYSSIIRTFQYTSETANTLLLPL